MVNRLLEFAVLNQNQEALEKASKTFWISDEVKTKLQSQAASLENAALTTPNL